VPRTATNELEPTLADQLPHLLLHLRRLLVPPAKEKCDFHVDESTGRIVCSGARDSILQQQFGGNSKKRFAPSRHRTTVSRMYWTRASWIELLAP
jgi:hypothetical protein